MSRTKKSIFTNIDWAIVGLYLVLVLMGWLNIYATLYGEDSTGIFDFSQIYGKQLMWIGLSVVVGLILFLVDSRLFETFAYVFYGIGIFVIAIALGKLWFGMLVVVVSDKGYKRRKEMEEIQSKNSTVDQVKQTLSEKFMQAAQLLSKKEDDPWKH